MRFFSVFLIGLSLTLPAWGIPRKGHHMMISATSPYATEVGQKIAEKGGNVVDVAVAVGLTMAVTAPYYSAFGGGGFALVKVKDKVEVLDFREKAPKETHPKFYLDKDKEASLKGGTAVGVPGFPAGLWALHKKYGKLHWSQLFTHPIRLAKQGYRVTGEWAKNVKRASDNFNDAGKKFFLKDKGKLYKPGEVFKQKALAKVLKEMRNRNVASFYKGRVAHDIVKSVKESGGVMTLDDLKNYEVRWLKPITTQWRGHTMYLMPPPSSGGVVLKAAFNLVDRLKVGKQAMYSANEFHFIGEVLSRAFRGRALLADPDFHNNPISALLSPKYLKKMANSIDSDESEKLKPLASDWPKGSNETTHWSVLDSKGRAVSLTMTLNGNFGSKVVTEKFGIALNNEMNDFTTRPGEPNMFGLIQGLGNKVEPGKRPLSSMSPTLIGKNNKIIMALGAQGGPRIITSVFHTVYRKFVSKLDLDAAIQSPRVHHQFLPHKLFIDENRFSPEVVQELRKRDHEVEEGWMGRVYAVYLNDEGILEAAYDSRGEGSTGGF